MAGAGSGGTVQVEATFFGTDNVLRQMNVIGRAGEQFGSAMVSKMGKMFGAVALGTMAFSKLEQSISKNMATAKQVSSLAVKFNVDPSQVHSMKIAADDAGVSIRSLMMASKQFGKVAGEALSNKAAAENMKQLGIPAEKLADMQSKPMKYLPEAAAKLATIADDNERAAAGAFLFGRQYQQIAPLLEKLGNDEEARGEFLSNNNAMTNEQIRMNKEAARIQSQLSEGWDKFVAAATPALNWAMNFASALANALSTMMGLIANQDKLKKAKEEQVAGKSVIGVETHMSNLAHRLDATKQKVTKGFALGLSDQDVGITKEEREEYDKVYAAGGIEKYMSDQFGNAYTAGEESKRNIDKMQAAAYTSSGHGYMPIIENTKTAADARAKVDPAFLKAVGGEYQLGHLDPKEAAKIQRKLKIAAAVANAPQHGLISLKGMTQDPETGEKSYRGPLAGIGSAILTAGQKKEEEVIAGQTGTAIAARRAWARMSNREYDPQTGKEYSQEEYAELMRARGKDKETGQVGSYVDAKAANAAKKKEKAQIRALEKSERHLKGDNLTGVQKAEEAIVDIQGDMAPIQEDIVEKKQEEEAAIARIRKNTEELAALDKKNSEAKENSEKAIAIAREAAKQAGEELTADEEKEIKDKFKLTLEETEKIAQLNGAIKGDQKVLKQTEGERLELQTKLNGEKSKEKAAIEALKKAKESEWAKEKQAAKDIADDKKGYEREMQQLKYKNMKLEGASQLDIMKEKYNDELAHYTEAAQEREALEEEIAAKQQARVEAAFQAGEENPYEAGKATDEENAQIKAAREKQDAGRKGLTDALYAMDSIKPHAVVSELGKMGGGAAVQFGNNPVDEIRKSNSFLKAIEKNTSSKAIKEVQKFETKAEKAYNEMESGLFGEDVPM